MFIEILMSHTKLKPIIEVQIISGVNKIPVQALIDTGSSKAFWVDSKDLFKKFATSQIRNNGTAGGLGIKSQINCPVGTMTINLRDSTHGLNFRDVPVTHAKVENAGLFSIILPYTLFNGFDFGFKPDEQNEFGNFYLDTQDNQINYKAVAGINDTVCGAYVCTDENAFAKHNNIEKVSAF